MCIALNMRETTMTELSKPKIIPIEHRPQKSKLFIKCVVLPIVIFLIVAKIFSFWCFRLHLLWLWPILVCDSLLPLRIWKYLFWRDDWTTEASRRNFNYQNRGVWINSQDKTIILFDQPDQRLVKYPFDYITSVGHYNLVEDNFRTTTTVISNPMMGTHVNQQVHRTPMKREFQVNIGTRDPFKPNYSLKVLFPWRSPQMASEIRQLLSADHYQ